MAILFFIAFILLQFYFGCLWMCPFHRHRCCTQLINSHNKSALFCNDSQFSHTHTNTHTIGCKCINSIKSMVVWLCTNLFQSRFCFSDSSQSLKSVCYYIWCVCVTTTVDIYIIERVVFIRTKCFHLIPGVSPFVFFVIMITIIVMPTCRQCFSLDIFVLLAFYFCLLLSFRGYTAE